VSILLRLTCVAGPLKGKTTDVSTAAFVVGRLPASHLVLPAADALASRVHAKIETRSRRSFIADQNSTNGTYLNGLRLDPFKPCGLSNGDSIRMGSSTFSISALANDARASRPAEAIDKQRQAQGAVGGKPAIANGTAVNSSVAQDEKPVVAILEKLATGGMSIIYTARFADTKQIVVMKIPDDESARSPEVLKLFEREIATGLHLRHPNIIQVLMRIDYHGLPAMIMEYFPSTPLNALISAGSLDLKQKLSILSQICEGLSYIHGRGIVHDDVKPGNILVGKGNLAKITDFGTAGTPASLKTAKDQWKLLGTTLYMSPEQIQGRDIDSRADIYGLGIIVYELLTGVNPFFREGNNSGAEIMERQLTLVPPLPSSIRPSIPRTADEPIMHALEKDPRKRTQTAQEFKNAMQRAWRQT
jgi:tRNA A-37 threonylcarbamoyl transferase component Bud32